MLPASIFLAFKYRPCHFIWLDDRPWTQTKLRNTKYVSEKGFYRSLKTLKSGVSVPLFNFICNSLKSENYFSNSKKVGVWRKIPWWAVPIFFVMCFISVFSLCLGHTKVDMSFIEVRYDRSEKSLCKFECKFFRLTILFQSMNHSFCVDWFQVHEIHVLPQLNEIFKMVFPARGTGQLQKVRPLEITFYTTYTKNLVFVNEINFSRACKGFSRF